MAKEKTNNSKLIIWALVALVIGVVIGLVITNLTTTGQAKEILDAKTEANIVEARQDLVLNLLRVNRIENRNGNPLEMVSTGANGQININATQMPISIGGNFDLQALRTSIYGDLSVGVNSTESIQMNTGISAINMYADSQDGPKMNLKSHRLNLTGNHISFTNTTGDSAMTINPTGDITINTPVKMPELTSVSPIVQVYEIGDTFTVENKTIEVAAIWDANGVVEMHLFDGNLLNPIVEFYEEGDIIFNRHLTTNLKIEIIDPNYVGIVILPSGDYYVCINSENELYKSLYPCN